MRECRNLKTLIIRACKCLTTAGIIGAFQESTRCVCVSVHQLIYVCLHGYMIMSVCDYVCVCDYVSVIIGSYDNKYTDID